MKKGIITMSVLAIIACTITAYCWAAGNETVSESTNVAQSLSGQQVKSTSQSAKGKSLVVYFSVPETDGVDASSGASRLVSNGKVMGNTQYIASVISEATGSDLFEIKTVHTYPGSHKALIDAAKVEIDNTPVRSWLHTSKISMTTMWSSSDSPTGGTICRCRSTRSSTNTTSAARPLSRSVRMAAAVSRMPSRPYGSWSLKPPCWMVTQFPVTVSAKRNPMY